MPQLKGGKLKALAVTTPQRMTSLPQVPTVAESGLAGFSHSLWGGLFAPTGTPQNIIDILNQEVNAALAGADLKSRLEGDNMAVPRNSPADFAAFVSAEAQKFDRLAREANLRSAP